MGAPACLATVGTNSTTLFISATYSSLEEADRVAGLIKTGGAQRLISALALPCGSLLWASDRVYNTPGQTITDLYGCPDDLTSSKASGSLVPVQALCCAAAPAQDMYTWSVTTSTGSSCAEVGPLAASLIKTLAEDDASFGIADPMHLTSKLGGNELSVYGKVACKTFLDINTGASTLQIQVATLSRATALELDRRFLTPAAASWFIRDAGTACSTLCATAVEPLADATVEIPTANFVGCKAQAGPGPWDYVEPAQGALYDVPDACCSTAPPATYAVTVAVSSNARCDAVVESAMDALFNTVDQPFYYMVDPADWPEGSELAPNGEIYGYVRCWDQGRAVVHQNVASLAFKDRIVLQMLFFDQSEAKAMQAALTQLDGAAPAKAFAAALGAPCGATLWSKLETLPFSPAAPVAVWHGAGCSEPGSESTLSGPSDVFTSDPSLCCEEAENITVVTPSFAALQQPTLLSIIIPTHLGCDKAGTAIGDAMQAQGLAVPPGGECNQGYEPTKFLNITAFFDNADDVSALITELEQVSMHAYGIV